MSDFDPREQLLLRARLESLATFAELAEQLGYGSESAARRAFYGAQAKLALKLKAGLTLRCRERTTRARRSRSSSHGPSSCATRAEPTGSKKPAPATTRAWTRSGARSTTRARCRASCRASRSATAAWGSSSASASSCASGSAPARWGVVYAAQDTTLDRQVAVKVLRHGLTERESTTQRFAREARAMASVEHEAVITIHDRGTTDEDEPFLVMELVDGVALSEIVQAAAERKTPRDLERAGWIEDELGLGLRGEGSYVRTVTRWISELANGLSDVHAAGVLHRDIKPSNIIVRRDGRPVLLDFGIALLDGDSSLTRGQTSVGTPAYMPPEALGRNKRSAASDVYSLTATLHHLLALAPPYEGNPSQVLAAIATREPVPARTHRPGIPRDLQAILDKGMQRKPSARYASTAELEADLRAFLEFRPISVRPITAPERWVKRAVRSRMVQGALLLALFAGLAVGASTWMKSHSDARARQYFEVTQAFPPSLGVLDLANRRYADEEQRAHIEGLLDEAVALGIAPETNHLLRGTFRYDHGDGGGAVRDMEQLAERVDSPFMRELAERYSVACSGDGPPAQLDLQDLPELESPFDSYVFAFHAIRWGQQEFALELLDAPEVRKIDHASLLRLICVDLESVDATEEYSRAMKLYGEVLELERRLGGRTANTAHLLGYALAAASQYDEALEYIFEGLTLAPGRAYDSHERVLGGARRWEDRTRRPTRRESHGTPPPAPSHLGEAGLGTGRR